MLILSRGRMSGAYLIVSNFPKLHRTPSPVTTTRRARLLPSSDELFVFVVIIIILSYVINQAVSATGIQIITRYHVQQQCIPILSYKHSSSETIIETSQSLISRGFELFVLSSSPQGRVNRVYISICDTSYILLAYKHNKTSHEHVYITTSHGNMITDCPSGRR